MSCFLGEFPMPMLRGRKSKRQPKMRVQEKTWACKINTLSGLKNTPHQQTQKTQNKITFSKAEIISSHATITKTEILPKWIKDLKTKHKIYSGKTRKYKVMWMKASRYPLETLLSDTEIFVLNFWLYHFRMLFNMLQNTSHLNTQEAESQRN